MGVKWKNAMEKKGLKVNIGKTKVMCSEYGVGRVNKTSNYPCGVCGFGVGEKNSNSIACTKCRHWIHKRCSGVKIELRNLLKLKLKITHVENASLRYKVAVDSQMIKSCS